MQWLRLSRRRMLQGMGALGAAASIPSRAPRADSNVLRVRDRYGLNSLDPAYMNTEILITRAIYTSLVQYKPFTDKWEWELDAAESIEQVDPTHIRFTLRPNIMWTNGFGEVTTEDVKFSYERHIDPDVASHYAGILGDVGSRRHHRQVFRRHRHEGAVRPHLDEHALLYRRYHHLQGGVEAL